MTREEQKTNAAIEMYPAGTQNSLQFRVGFATGVEWADEHPKEGLWDAEKVCDFLKNKCIFSASNSPVIVEFDGEELVRKLRKAMEE